RRNEPKALATGKTPSLTLPAHLSPNPDVLLAGRGHGARRQRQRARRGTGQHGRRDRPDDLARSDAGTCLLPLRHLDLEHPDQLAQAERAEGVREDLGVAVGAVVDQQHCWLGPLAVVGSQHQALTAETVPEEGVLARTEIIQHLLMSEAPAVEAYVENERLLV